MKHWLRLGKINEDHFLKNCGIQTKPIFVFIGKFQAIYEQNVEKT